MSNSPLILLVGAPRSGTTFLYQVLIQRYNLDYIDNISNRFPVFFRFSWTFRKMLRREVVVKESHYGHVSGLFSPSEGAHILNRGFGLGRWHRQKSSFFDQDASRLLASFHSRYRKSGRPIVLKNLRLSFEVGEFLNTCSNVIVIFVRRDRDAIFKSILSARIGLMGSSKKWWSIVPPGMEVDKNDSPPDEIMQQIESFHSAIGNYAGDPRLFTLDYEYYMSDAQGCLKKLDEFINSFIHSSAN